MGLNMYVELLHKRHYKIKRKKLIIGVDSFDFIYLKIKSN